MKQITPPPMRHRTTQAPDGTGRRPGGPRPGRRNGGGSVHGQRYHDDQDPSH